MVYGHEYYLARQRNVRLFCEKPELECNGTRRIAVIARDHHRAANIHYILGISAVATLALQYMRAIIAN